MATGKDPDIRSPICEVREGEIMNFSYTNKRLECDKRGFIKAAGMGLGASLFRTESRGFHYREDYPNKNDKNWLAWVIISKDGDNMKLTKRPVPDAWKV